MNKPATITAPAEQQDGPSLFVGIALEVNEIVACRDNLDLPCARLRAGMADRHEAAVKQAADDIAKIAGQMQTLRAHLSSVISRHLARSPRA